MLPKKVILFFPRANCSYKFSNCKFKISDQEVEEISAIEMIVLEISTLKGGKAK